MKTKLYKGMRTTQVDINKLEPRASANGAFFFMTHDEEVAKRYGNHLLCIEIEEEYIWGEYTKVDGMPDATELRLTQLGLNQLLVHAWSISIDGVEL